MKTTIHAALALFFSVTALITNVYGQKKRLYFFADTLHTNVLTRSFEIGNEGKEGQYYLFYCKCIPPYQQNTLFAYYPYRTKPTYTEKLPTYKFTAWSELSGLLSEKGRLFDTFFELYVVEPLPNKSFMINRVNLFIKKETVVN